MEQEGGSRVLEGIEKMKWSTNEKNPKKEDPKSDPPPLDGSSVHARCQHHEPASQHVGVWALEHESTLGEDCIGPEEETGTLS